MAMAGSSSRLSIGKDLSIDRFLTAREDTDVPDNDEVLNDTLEQRLAKFTIGDDNESDMHKSRISIFLNDTEVLSGGENGDKLLSDDCRRRRQLWRESSAALMKCRKLMNKNDQLNVVCSGREGSSSLAGYVNIEQQMEVAARACSAALDNNSRRKSFDDGTIGEEQRFANNSKGESIMHKHNNNGTCCIDDDNNNFADEKVNNANDCPAKGASNLESVGRNFEPVCGAIVKIKIEDFYEPNRGKEGRQQQELKSYEIKDIIQIKPQSGSAMDISGPSGDLNHLQAKESANNHGSRKDCFATGSLSDNTPEMKRSAMLLSTQNRNNIFYLDSNRQQGARDIRLKNWKRSQKIITHIRENPFNLHMDCLERLSKEAGVQVDQEKICQDIEEVEQIKDQEVNKSDIARNEANQQQERLQTYAAHLTHLYQRNQAAMDSNAEFRNLLYNIICCLLIQDEQVLSTISVTKMIDVIRTYLESTAKFYANSIESITKTSQNFNALQQHQQQAVTVGQLLEDKRKGSCGSLSCTSSTSSGFNNFKSSNQQQQAFSRSQKPVDFRRISSVSYNDEQLIYGLCERSAAPSCNSCATDDQSGRQNSVESPWRFEELSSECKHHNGFNLSSTTNEQFHTSSSSLENGNHSPANQTISDLMNDSGIGTICDFNNDDNVVGYKGKRLLRGKRLSDTLEYKPKQKPSYVSTDDYLSQIQDANDSKTLYSYDESPFMQSRRHSATGTNAKPVDVASRRAELEWTLNKLINYELKYTWLTSRDTLRRAIRRIGVPNEIRGKVWMILIDQMIGSKYDAAKLLEEAGKTISEDEAMVSLIGHDDETQGILKQIDLDVNRTMPGHKMFDDGAEGGIKLRRILVAYSIHVNRAIAYCQGFNFIVALLLSVFDGDEEKALRGFVCIVDHIFPSKFYFDHYLTGARADQFLLADFICDQLIKNPTTVERKMVEGVTSSITLNWFISLFHGAVPTLTRLTILDHFMLDGVKALFRFTMAILYLAFQVTPPSSCEVFTTIRNTAKDMYDIKLLLSIVEQIKLPKDSYFAIRRSFYMVQSSFNSDQFYMQSLSNDAQKQLVSNKPLSVQQLPNTKQPAMSLIAAASSILPHHHQINLAYSSNNIDQQNFNLNSNAYNNGGAYGPRVCTSADNSKVVIQNIGKLGRSHIKIIDANVRSNERSLMSPLRNCLVIGISNCGKKIFFARQSSKRNFKTFREQDLLFHVHELCSDIFDGFYLEQINFAIIITHLGEIFKINTGKCFADSQLDSTETLLLKDSHSIGDYDKVKLKLASMDTLTNLLWIYVECEDTSVTNAMRSQSPASFARENRLESSGESLLNNGNRPAKFKSNNPFLSEADLEMLENNQALLDSHQEQQQQAQFPIASPASIRPAFLRKILIIDLITFDLFSAFSVHKNFGEIRSLRTSLVAFCQLANPMSNQFSSRIVRIGPTGRYEHLLSFSDVVDFIIKVPDMRENNSMSNKKTKEQEEDLKSNRNSSSNNLSISGYSALRKFLPRSMSQNVDLTRATGTAEMNLEPAASEQTNGPKEGFVPSSATLTRYYRSLIKSQSITVNISEEKSKSKSNSSSSANSNSNNGGKRIESIGAVQSSANDTDNRSDNRQKSFHFGGHKLFKRKGNLDKDHSSLPRVMTNHPTRTIITSYLGEMEDMMETNYIPVNMAFIFKNGKIALFEFTESYAIHTRESQLDRYDYSKIIEVTKNGDDFIITILTIFDKLIKVVM